MPSDNDDAIFKVQTVPPPPGSTDAYSAPTRVGEMGASVLDEMIVAAKRNAEQPAAPLSLAPSASSTRPTRPTASTRSGWRIALRVAVLAALLLLLGILGGAAFLLLRR